MSPEDHYEELACEYCANWRKFHSFGWSDKPDDPDSFAIIYTTSRDASLVEESNTEVFRERLRKDHDEEVDSEDLYYDEHNHWAVGWVGGFVVRVRNQDGTVTNAWRYFCENYLLPLSDYPVLDDEDHSEREVQAWMLSIEQNGRNRIDGAPEDWDEQVYIWLRENKERAFEYCHSEGPYVSRDEVDEALEALGLLDTE